MHFTFFHALDNKKCLFQTQKDLYFKLLFRSGLHPIAVHILSSRRQEDGIMRLTSSCTIFIKNPSFICYYTTCHQYFYYIVLCIYHGNKGIGLHQLHLNIPLCSMFNQIHTKTTLLNSM